MIEEGRGVALERPERVRHRLQTLLGVFDAYGVTAQQIKPVVSVGDLVSAASGRAGGGSRGEGWHRPAPP